MSFGGPEAPDDVIPFLENVTRGRNIPRERLAEVGEHYFLFGGRSPINDQNRALLAAIREDLAGAGIDLPVYWGNRNWDPYLTDALRQMAADGVTRAACFVTSAYSSYSGCRQYREDLAAAVGEVGGELAGARGWTGCATTSTTRASSSRSSTRRSPPSPSCPVRVRDDARLVFVTHSIPESMAEGSGRPTAARTSPSTARRWPRSSSGCGSRPATGRPTTSSTARGPGRRRVPWLEPDVNDHLAPAGQGRHGRRW